MSKSKPFHAPALLSTKPSLCGRNGKLATRPLDVTCGKCWHVMLARRMVAVQDIPDHIEVGIPRHLCVELGLPVLPLVPTSPKARGDLMTREQRKEACRMIPLAEVRRMLKELGR